MASQFVNAAEDGTWLRNGWQPYASNFSGSANAFQEDREHWLQSRLKFSGRTERNSDGLDGALGVAADRLMGRNDAVGFSYRDARSYANNRDSSSASLRYHLPAGSNRLRIEAGQSRYGHAVSTNGRRYDASGESRVMALGISRPLFSRFGMAVDGVASHRGRNSTSFEEASLVSQSRYRLSTFGFNANGGHELAGGFYARTGLLALRGRESRASEWPLQEGHASELDFFKLSMSASLERELFQWNWRFNGRFQFADEDLPASEYLTVVGPSMLSGFNGQSLSSFKGGWLRFGTASPTWPLPFVDGVVSSINLAVLQGWIPYTSGPGADYGRASAGQVSLKMRGRAFTAHVSVGRMIRAANVAMTVPEHPDLRFSLSMGI